ncbi:MAG: mechanosensitive ion channel family protein [Candidatus Micrarchaeia archaeon]|jgi:MscS family membrane protein
MDFLNITVFGTTIINYAYFLFITLGTIILAKVAYYIIKGTISRFTKRTKTKLDDLLMSALEKPFIVLILIFGAQFGLEFLSLPNGYGNTAQNILGVLLTFNIAWFIVGVLNSFIENYVEHLTRKTESKLDDQILPIFKKGVFAIVFILALITALNNFGYDVTALLGGLGIAGIAVAMAAQSTLGDLLGGINIFTGRPFEVDDWINFGGKGGQVTEVGMRNTRLKSFDGTLLTVPNSILGKEIIENYTKAEKRRIRFNIGLTYNTSTKQIAKAKEILLKITKEIEGIEKDSATVHFKEFADSSINLMFTYYIIDTSKFLDIQDEVNTKIKERFDKNKLDFAFPSQTIYLKK